MKDSSGISQRLRYFIFMRADSTASIPTVKPPAPPLSQFRSAVPMYPSLFRTALRASCVAPIVRGLAGKSGPPRRAPPAMKVAAMPRQPPPGAAGAAPVPVDDAAALRRASWISASSAPAQAPTRATPSPLAAHLAAPAWEPTTGPPSVPASLVVQLRLKAYHKFYLNRFAVALGVRLSELGLPRPSQVFLPKRTERFTVLRSPHVDKRARDQFERVTHKRLVTLRLPTDSDTIALAYRVLSGITSLAPGVEMQATYFSSMRESNR